jgi:hypothetical protein
MLAPRKIFKQRSRWEQATPPESCFCRQSGQCPLRGTSFFQPSASKLNNTKIVKIARTNFSHLVGKEIGEANQPTSSKKLCLPAIKTVQRSISLPIYLQLK